MGTASDPWTDLQAFVAEVGLPTDFRAPGPGPRAGVAGVALLLGHAAAVASMSAGERSRAGQPAASPASRVPDLVAVAYERVESHREVESLSSEVTERAGGFAAEQWLASWDPAEHAAAVEAVRAAIAAGEVYQVNVVGHRRARLDGVAEAQAVAWRLVEVGAAYGGSVVGDGWSVHSASPELLVGVRDGRISTEPIKGTIAGTGPDEVRSLRDSRKDRAEHVMIVDLERNDLARLATIGSVEVRDLYQIRPWAGLSHAHSTVSARLRPGVELAEVLGAVLPGGSVTGAPKVAALRILHDVEPVGRGPAMGAMGWLAADGSLELGLTIRTVACDHVDGWIDLWTGGGVTWASTAEGEVAEAEAKAAAVVSAVQRS